MTRAADLVLKIVTLTSNPHYRMSDIVFGLGARHEDSAKQVLSLPEFEGTILRQYLIESGGKPGNLALLSDLVDRAIATHGYAVPAEDELVVHIRAGDVVQYDWFLKRDFAGEIGRYRDVRRCSIVTAFAFREFTDRQWWMFSEEKLRKNIDMMTALLDDLLARFPDIAFDVVSSRCVDRDFAWLVSATHYIPDASGFSLLAQAVRDYRRTIRLQTAPGAFIAALCRIGFEAPRLDVGRVVGAGESSSDPFFTHGWHARQPMNRWSALPKAELLLSVPRPGLGLSLSMNPLRAGDTVSAFVNGEPVSSQWLSERNLVVPIAGDGTTSITLAVDACFSPRELGINEDGRQLGVSVDSFELIELLDRGADGMAAAAELRGREYSSPGEWKLWGLPESLAGKTFLEVGCWEEILSIEAIRRGARKVLALDYCTSPKILATAAQHGLDFLQLDILSEKALQLPEFDIVLCAGVLSYVESPFSLLFRLRKLCRPGGTLFLETTCLNVWGEPMMVFHPSDSFDGNLSNWWTPSEACLTAMLTEAGFGEVSITHKTLTLPIGRICIRATSIRSPENMSPKPLSRRRAFMSAA